MVVLCFPLKVWYRIVFQELRKQYQIISELRAEIKALQADNLKLYEKVRYMQSYREESGSRPVTQLDPLPALPGRPDDMTKYQARYEEAMNPFEAFRGRVSWRSFSITVMIYQSLRKPQGPIKTLTPSSAVSSS